MTLVAVKCPIARIIRDEFNRACCARRHVHRDLGPARLLGDLTAVRPNDPELMAVKMNRMTVHAQVRETNPHTLIQLYDERVSAWPDAAIESAQIEIGHDVRIGRVTARLNKPFLQENAEMPIHSLGVTTLRMNPKQPLHPHRH